MLSNMKVLALDIETAPNTAHVWGLFKQNISINQIQQTGRVMCFSAKWVGARGKPEFYSEWHDGEVAMLNRAWELLDEADVVLSYNGKSFDMPMLNRDFFKARMIPPMPYHHIDLLKTARRAFRFPSNKMDHICKELDLRQKMRHEGHELWTKCMDGDAKAWGRMMRYNTQDVRMLEDLYHEMRPWIDDHPNVALYKDGQVDTPTCPNCGSTDMVRKGLQHNRTQSYQRYRCNSCGTPARGRYTVVPKNTNILSGIGR